MSQQINLANPQLLRKRHAFGVREMVIAGSVVLAAALAWGSWTQHRATRLEDEANAAEARLADAQRALDAQLAASRRPASALLAQRVEAVAAQVAQREALLESIGRLAGASPGFAARLRALSHSHVDGVWLNGFELTPDALALRGSALQAGQLSVYLERLGQQAPFAGLSFAAVQAVPAQASPGDARPPAQVDFELHAGVDRGREGSHEE